MRARTRGVQQAAHAFFQKKKVGLVNGVHAPAARVREGHVSSGPVGPCNRPPRLWPFVRGRRLRVRSRRQDAVLTRETQHERLRTKNAMLVVVRGSAVIARVLVIQEANAGIRRPLLDGRSWQDEALRALKGGLPGPGPRTSRTHQRAVCVCYFSSCNGCFIPVCSFCSCVCSLGPVCVLIIFLCALSVPVCVFPFPVCSLCSCVCSFRSCVCMFFLLLRGLSFPECSFCSCVCVCVLSVPVCVCSFISCVRFLCSYV